jgi:7,8-dihydroneopterin aldolase/epimerase/oxygenase
MKILARGISFEGRHGVTAAERRAAPRKFEVDVEVEVAGGRAAETDRLADTLDYYRICETIVEIGTTGTCKLLETLATRMAAALRQRTPEAIVTVEVRKLHPPCPGTPQFTAVRVTLPRTSGK